MSAEKAGEGCKIHGSKEICGHTTVDCPKVDAILFRDLNQLIANDITIKNPTVDFEAWQDTLIRIRDRISYLREALSSNNDTQQESADELSILNEMIGQGNLVLDFSRRFLTSHPKLPFEEQEIIRGIITEMAAFVSEIMEVKLSITGV